LWLDSVNFFVFYLLLGAQICDSFTEFFNLGFRRFEKYLNETQTALITSAIHILAVISGVLVFQTALAAAVCFFASRVIALLIVMWATKGHFQDVRWSGLRLALARVRSTWAFALEVALFTGYSQIDTLVINHFLGHESLGIYQAGMKLVEGACRIAPVLAQVLIPRLAATTSQSAKFKTGALRAVATFCTVGAAGCAVLYFGAPWIVQYVYGQSFAALEPLLPLFGVMLFLRYLETATGMLLVSYGLQYLKVWLVLGQFLFVILLGVLALKFWGLVGWQVGCLAGTEVGNTFGCCVGCSLGKLLG
jgi:O-antigen/teichoic acid export membrane protein